MDILFIIFVIIAYLLGSLSSAILVCKFLGLPDPRTVGSGNPGATNVLRLGGKQAAIIVLVVDILKGFIPVLIAHLFGITGFELGVIALAALLGHVFPVFFNFKGGKGVATAIGTFFGISLFLGVVAALVWGAVAAITRYSSLASLSATVIATILSPWITGDWGYFLPLAILTGVLVWRHLGNINRLREGSEPKIGQS